MGLLADGNAREWRDFSRLYFIRLRTNIPTALTNHIVKAHTRNDKPLGLVFWQGRRWSGATTLPQSVAHGNPLGLVFQNQPRIGMGMF